MKAILMSSLSAVVLAAWLTPAAAEVTPPDKVISDTAARALEVIEAQRERLKTDPEAAAKVVEEVLLPAFDLDYAARLVLGKHARNATPEQTKRFRDAFYRFLVRTYSQGLAQYTKDRLRILPFRGPVDEQRTIVKTEIYRDDGTAVPVDYTLRLTPQGWKVYDVTIEGISYVTNYRNTFGAEIEQTSLDALISRLEKAPEDGGNKKS